MLCPTKMDQELLPIRALVKKHNPEKPALVVPLEKGVMLKVSFQTVVDISVEIKQFISHNIPSSEDCIGLLMEKNTLIPSIIMCLQDLGHSFAFLTSQALVESCNRLCIQWVVAKEVKLPENHFALTQKLRLSTEEELELCKYKGCLHAENKKCGEAFCVMQTSGSTGESKVVKVPYGCIEKNVTSLNQHFRVTPEDVIYWGTPLTFDPTLVELLLALTYGATLVVVPKSVQLNPSQLYLTLFRQIGITFLQVVPSVFFRFTKQQIGEILLHSPLKTLAFGGEPFPREVLAFERQPGLKLYNLYGVTELSCWATIADLTSHDGSQEAPLGASLDETFVELQSTEGSSIAAGVGEICIGSHTRFCLLDNVPIGTPVQTGDLGEMKNGRLYFRGRKSRCIKRFGHRVVLHRVEETIWENTHLRSRMVYSSAQQTLLAFVVIPESMPEGTRTRTLDKLRVKLLNVLDEHCVPDYLDIVSHLPLNQHGKISDQYLEKLYRESHENIGNVGDVFIELLNRQLRVDVHLHQDKTLAQLGIGSLLTMLFVAAFQKHVGEAKMDEFFTILLNETIGDCRQFVERHMRLIAELPSYQEAVMGSVGAVSGSSWVLWSYDMRGCVDASPIAFSSREEFYVACGSFAHKLAVLDENGHEQVCAVLPQEVEAQPAISTCRNFLFCPCSNGTMYCLDLNLKEMAWHYQTSEKISPACVWVSFLAFGSYNGNCYCLSLKGVLVWTATLYGAVKAEPIHDQNLKRVYVGSTRGMCYALDENRGTQLWSCKLEGPIFGAGAVVGDCTIWPSVTGKIVCLDLQGRIRWTLKADGHIFASLRIHCDSIYFGCQDGYLYKISPDRQLERLAQLGGEITSTPFLYEADSKLLLVTVCNNGSLHVLEVDSRTAVCSMQLPAQSFSSPFVLNGRVYVGCRDDRLYCIDLKRAIKGSAN